jgi:biopolymer transport protein ExbB
VPASASLRLLPAQGFTTSAWVKPDGAGGEQIVLALTDAGKQLSLGLAAARPFARFSAGSAPVSVMAPAELASGGWHHLAVTAGGGQLRLYVDGEPVAGGAVALAEIGGVFSIGSDAQGGSAFAGEIDEVEAAKVARPAEWFRVAVKSQGLDSPLVVYGGDAQKEGGGTSYFGTILKNLTVDGWVVIGICLAMLAVAIVVMVMKALYLGRVERANRRFLEQFRREPAEQRIGRSDGGGPAALGPELTAGSTLYELYRVASDELAKRLAYAKPGGDRSVSAQSVEAIRASVDATSTRMQQQLSARMVLLTIAISGGPFLGLLGTVIGVMITFAAIAASGDVNVNAIAPGTAAALAATVAGLSVAIPSLFGYNWLNSRIKAINADQRVFADELIAQIAERHS